jgi:ArsR family transcriptional regulator, arsenate/arsenite/antimonite-responsive transcriptional repressor
MDGMRDLASFFRALGDETRLRLVALLAQQQPGRAMCVGRLAQELGVTASAVSQHLRLLKSLGLVHATRRGYRLHYFLDLQRLASYQDLVREQLGEGFVAHESETNPGGRPSHPPIRVPSRRV